MDLPAGVLIQSASPWRPGRSHEPPVGSDQESADRRGFTANIHSTHLEMVVAVICAETCIGSIMPGSARPSFPPSWSLHTDLGSLRSLGRRKPNMADVLLFQDLFHLPKYTGPAFVTSLCVWSGNAVKKKLWRSAWLARRRSNDTVCSCFWKP